MSKDYDALFGELWSVAKDAAKDLFEEEHVKAKARDLVEYAARAQLVIHTSSDANVRELARREFVHRSAHIEGDLALLALEATKKSRLTGILEGIFNVLLKFGPVLLS